MVFRYISRPLFYAFLVGSMLRLLLAAQPFYNFDIESYSIVVGIVRHGGNVYAETYRYNYSPVWFNVLNLLSYIPVAFPFVVRGFLTVVDLFNAFLLKRIMGSHAAILYLLSPVAILIVGYHGQFDTLSATPLLLAMAFFQSPQTRSSWKPWVLAVLSILIKHLLVFGAWTLLVYRYGVQRATRLFVLASLILALSFVPFLPEGAEGILQNVLLYRSISVVIGFGTFPPAVALALFVVLMMSVPFVAQWLQLDEREALGLSAVSLIAFIPGTSPQYWIIVSLFGLGLLHRLKLERWYITYTIVTTIALLVVYAVFAKFIAWAWLLVMDAVWLACMVAIYLVYRSARIHLRPAQAGATLVHANPRPVSSEEVSHSP